MILKSEFEKLPDKKHAYEVLLSKAKEIHRKDEEFCLKNGQKWTGSIQTEI